MTRLEKNQKLSILKKEYYKRNPMLEKWKRKISKSLKGKNLGEKNGSWKGGISYDEKKCKREWRHRLGISKKYISKYGGKALTKREHRLLRKYNKKRAGKLTIQNVQKVYEANIKCFGTLTCIYCLNPTQFGKDTLEHKQPLSRGGKNIYKNLAIACNSCNSSKKDKTEKEFREWRIK